MTDARKPPARRAMPQALIKERVKPQRRVYGSVSSRARDLAARGFGAAEIREELVDCAQGAVDAAIYRCRLREELPRFEKKRPTLLTIEVDQLSARRITTIADERQVTPAMIARVLLKRAVRAEIEGARS